MSHQLRHFVPPKCPNRPKYHGFRGIQKIVSIISIISTVTACRLPLTAAAALPIMKENPEQLRTRVRGFTSYRQSNQERTKSEPLPREGREGACKISAGAAQNDRPNPSQRYKQNQTRDRLHRGYRLPAPRRTETRYSEP